MNYVPLLSIPMIPQPRLSGVGRSYSAVDFNRDGVFDTTSLEGDLKQGSEPLVDMTSMRKFAISQGKHLLTSADIDQNPSLRLVQWTGDGDSDSFLRIKSETFPQLETLRAQADELSARRGREQNFSGPADWGINVVDEQFIFFRPLHDLSL